MNFNVLTEIDFTRVRDVLQGNRIGRRCGKTTAILLLMISHAIQDTKEKYLNFLFVTENNENAQGVHRLAILMLDEIGFNITNYGSQNLQCQTMFRGRNIKFHFYGADAALSASIKGRRFNQAFVDLTLDTTTAYRKELNDIRLSVIP